MMRAGLIRPANNIIISPTPSDSAKWWNKSYLFSAANGRVLEVRVYAAKGWTTTPMLNRKIEHPAGGGERSL
jgi:hypothetical protein